jgi:hypothetical protein
LKFPNSYNHAVSFLNETVFLFHYVVTKVIRRSNYAGSITLDEELMEAADIIENKKCGW